MSSLLTHVKPTSSVFNFLAKSAQPYRTDTLDYGCLFAIGRKTIQEPVARVTSYLIDKQFALRTLGLSTPEWYKLHADCPDRLAISCYLAT